MNEEIKSSLRALIAKDNDVATSLYEAKKEIEELSSNFYDNINNTLSKKKYVKEIEQGTKRKQLLIEQGTYNRTNDDESEPYDCFIPANDTPILNYLYFSSRDTKYDKIIPVLKESQYDNIDNEQDLLNILEEKYGTEFDNYVLKEKYSSLFNEDEINVTNVKEMESFIYDNMTHEIFKTIKKLKTFAISANGMEATIAENKCRKLCDKHKLDYEKIPTYYED